MSDSETPGVMDSRYAHGRVERTYMKWRYRTRALFAARAFRRRAPDLTAPRVLEFGAADGRTLLAMREYLGGEGEYVGVEYAEELIDAAPPLPEGVTLLQGDVMGLGSSLDAGNFDLCVALAVLEHLPDPAAAVAEAHRMLRPGGVFIASCPHPFWDHLAGALRLVPDEHHEDELDAERMRELALDAGFASASVEPFMHVPIASLSYLGIWVSPDWSLRVDEKIARLPFSGAGFVNQGLTAVRAP